MRKITSVAIICWMLTLIGCETKTTETNGGDDITKVGEFLYVQRDIVHIDRKCRAIVPLKKTRRIPTNDSIYLGTTFCPRCVDDETYKKLKEIVKP